MRTLALIGGFMIVVGVGLAGLGFFMDVTVASPDIGPCFAGLPCPETSGRIVNQHLVWRSYSLQLCGAALALLGGMLVVAGLRSVTPPPSTG